MLKCLKLWFRLGVFTEEDLYIIVAQQEKDAIKALEGLDQ